MKAKNLCDFLVIAIFCVSVTACSFGNKNIRLINAAKRGDTKTVEKLIIAGADINSRNKSGYTPYMAASSNGHLKTMKILEKAGAQKLVRE